MVEDLRYFYCKQLIEFRKENRKGVYTKAKLFIITPRNLVGRFFEKHITTVTVLIKYELDVSSTFNTTEKIAYTAPKS